VISKTVIHSLVIARSMATKQSLVMQKVEIASSPLRRGLAMTDYCKVVGWGLVPRQILKRRTDRERL